VSLLQTAKAEAEGSHAGRMLVSALAVCKRDTRGVHNMDLVCMVMLLRHMATIRMKTQAIPWLRWPIPTNNKKKCCATFRGSISVGVC